ncbi:unnamed protein product [Larinioides sclopetarius]|uniref:Uncharacterized protein n=1 Tax=Larinioides sclopetarius TaxID=280406 RepID=A0AAV2B9J1_9ARAC
MGLPFMEEDLSYEVPNGSTMEALTFQRSSSPAAHDSITGEWKATSSISPSHLTDL